MAETNNVDIASIMNMVATLSPEGSGARKDVIIEPAAPAPAPVSEPAPSVAPVRAATVRTLGSAGSLTADDVADAPATGRRGIRNIVGGERAGGAEGAHRGGTDRCHGRRGFRNGRWRWRSGLDDDILARAAPLRAQRGDHIHDGGDVDVVRFGHMKTLPSNSARHYILPDRWDTSCNPYAAARRRSRTAGPASPECVPSRSRRPEANHWGQTRATGGRPLGAEPARLEAKPPHAQAMLPRTAPCRPALARSGKLCCEIIH